MQTSQNNATLTSAHKNSTPQSELLVVKREFNVPVDLLFKAFTTAKAIKHWWWPKGLHSDHIDMDFRELGEYFINMKDHNKGGGGMAGQFQEIVENERIVMTDNFADENGKAISPKEAKMDGEWPEQVFITFEFEKIDDNLTYLTLSQEGIPNEAQKDCIQGWNEMFDKLGDFLNGRKN